MKNYIGHWKGKVKWEISSDLDKTKNYGKSKYQSKRSLAFEKGYLKFIQLGGAPTDLLWSKKPDVT